MKTLITARMNPADIARVQPYLGEIVQAGYGVTSEKLSESEFIKALIGVEIAIIEFEPVTAAVLDAARDLKILACCRNEPGANVNVSEATKRGIPILFTPGRNAIAVAEYTVGLLISIARNIPMTHHFLRHTEELTGTSYSDKSGERKNITSEWSLDPGAPFQRFSGVELSGKKIGLVGFGAIGREIAKRVKGFDMELLVMDPYVEADVLQSYEARSCGLDEIAAQSDFLVIAAKVTDQTRGMISQEIFRAMKPSAFFINTARAAMVDYDALILALAEGRIAGAALDVYPIEPIPSDSPLRRLNNVILSPHLSGATHEVPIHHSKMVIDDLIALLEGRSPKALANPEVLVEFQSTFKRDS